ncbi:MAG: homoserine dehydrogenase [Elusimicrobiota bacterium]|jgi:homoserine dehydrogenase|nr:homoserine dehydrogenase [Elusimicrobiota bacterium]
MTKETINIGLIGYGTVGKGVVRILKSSSKIIIGKVGKPIEVKSICDINPIDKTELYVKDFRQIIKDPDIDLIVELIGGYEPARTIIIESLKAGKNVVTANKAALAKFWGEIYTAIQTYQKSVYYEAAVGGAIPVIAGLTEGLAGEEILEIKGILNGTTNFILSKMTKDALDYKSALKEAQSAGFAETDPSFDVNGIDTANKLAILASLAWGSWIKVKDISVSGIADLDIKDVSLTKRNGSIKLIGSAVKMKNGIDLSVQPCFIGKEHPFSSVRDEYNAVMIKGKNSGDVLFYGKGAGQGPAASAVVSDIINLSQFMVTNTKGIIPDIIYDPKIKNQILPFSKSKAAYYLRFTVSDKPGVFAKLADILGKHKVSIASLSQPNISRGDFADIVIITHPSVLEDLNSALKEIKSLRSIIKSAPVKIKIETF